MKIPNLSKEFKIKFEQKPLLIGGMAKEYYGLRKSGIDIDFVLAKEDHKKLERKLQSLDIKYLKGKTNPGYKKNPVLVDLCGDRGILYRQFEIWNQILGYGYQDLVDDSKELKNCKVISLEKQLLLTSFMIDKPKHFKDLKLITKKILENKYGAKMCK